MWSSCSYGTSAIAAIHCLRRVIVRPDQRHSCAPQTNGGSQPKGRGSKARHASPSSTEVHWTPMWCWTFRVHLIIFWALLDQTTILANVICYTCIDTLTSWFDWLSINRSSFHPNVNAPSSWISWILNKWNISSLPLNVFPLRLPFHPRPRLRWWESPAWPQQARPGAETLNSPRGGWSRERRAYQPRSAWNEITVYMFIRVKYIQLPLYPVNLKQNHAITPGPHLTQKEL